MFEDNILPGMHYNFNMENISTYRKRVSHFQICNFLQQTDENISQSIKETWAKNNLIEINQTQGTHPLKLKDQRNIVNGWILHKNDKPKPLKSFRTKTFCKGKKQAYNGAQSLRSSIGEPDSHIPELKNILKKLQSPEKDEAFGNFKENILYSQKKKSQGTQKGIIPYKFQSVFRTINTRKASREKKKTIINFSNYKQSTKKQIQLEGAQDQLEGIANILVIKETGKKIVFRR